MLRWFVMSFHVVTEQYEKAPFVSDHYPIISELVY